MKLILTEDHIVVTGAPMYILYLVILAWCSYGCGLLFVIALDGLFGTWEYAKKVVKRKRKKRVQKDRQD